MHRIGSLVLCVGCLAGAASVRAGDVVLDNFTIGNPADDTALMPSGNIFGITEDLGQRHADNLFHSFFSFNIDSGETALFSGDPAIQNIISRVTGGDPSTIDGIVRSTIDGAGFWFINPAGMIIDSNAVFDVSGSLALGAADFVEFANAERWYAFAPPAGETSTFSVAPPATFGFLDVNTAGALTMSGVTLDDITAPEIDDVLIAGGRVLLDDTQLSTVGNVDDGGDITISGGDVVLNSDTHIVASTVGAGDAGDIVITGINSVTAQGDEDGADKRLALRIASSSGDPFGEGPLADLGAAGNVTIEGGAISLTRTAVLASTSSTESGHAAGSVSIEAPGATITLNDTEVSTATFGVNDAGSVSISGDNVLLLNGTFAGANTRGTGSAGDVTVHGANSVVANLDADGNVDDSLKRVLIASTSRDNEINPPDTPGTSGSAGSITITGGDIRFGNDTIVRAITESDRPDNEPASVLIEATNEVMLNGSTVVAPTMGGSDAGSITIDGTEVSLLGNTLVRAVTNGTGDAGDIVIRGTNSVTAQGAQRNSDDELALRIESASGDVFGLAAPSELGAAGNVTITGGTIRLTRAAVLASTSSNQADNATGSVRIAAPDNEIRLVDSEVSSATFGASDAGSVDISGGDIVLRDGTTVTANTRGTGSAGTVTVHGENSVRANVDADGNANDSLDRVLIASTSNTNEFGTPGMSGSAGSISITGGEIRLANTNVRAFTRSDRRDNTRASIRLAALTDVALTDSLITAFTSGDSDAGSIAIEGTDIVIRGESTVSATTNGTGDAGDIVIAGTGSVTARGGERKRNGELTLRIVSASGDALGMDPPSELGAAGNVTITGSTIRLSRAAVLASTSSNQADNATGSVRIAAPDNEIRLVDSEVSSATFGASDAGSVDISGGDIFLRDGTTVTANTRGTGSAGTVTVHGENSVRANVDAGGNVNDSFDRVLIASTSDTNEFGTPGMSGSAGSISITGGEIRLANTNVRALTRSNRLDNAPASIHIESPNEVTLIDATISALTAGDSDAGSIAIEGADVALLDGTLVRALANGKGDAGDIVISGTNSVVAQGGERNSDGHLTLRIVSASGDVFGLDAPSELGAAGNVTITGGTIRLSRVAVLASTSSNRSDNATGSVRIEALDNEITLSDSEVSSATFGSSNAGRVDIHGGEVSLLDQTSVGADTTGTGDGGEIAVTANALTLMDGASVSTSAQSTGNAGSIRIDVSGDLTLIGGSGAPSEITTDSRLSEGGDIEITAGGRLLARNGSIRASAGELGNGGDIALSAAEIVLQESDILAQADAGNGGQIDINSSLPGQDLLFVRDSLSRINADSNEGNAGAITISSPDTDINSAIRTQDVSLFDAPALTADACSPAALEERSSLIVEDRGGVPPPPDGYLSGIVAGVDPRARETEVESGAHIDAEGGVSTVAVAILPAAAGCQ